LEINFASETKAMDYWELHGNLSPLGLHDVNEVLLKDFTDLGNPNISHEKKYQTMYKNVTFTKVFNNK